MENTISGWLSSGKLVAPKGDNIQYMSDFRRIAWYSPSPLTMPFMTPFMRVSINWYNAESFSNPIPPSVVLYLNSVLAGWQVGK